MVLKDDMEVYISGGAVIQGILIANKVENAKVWGHGFFDGSHNDSWMLSSRTAYVPISLSDCENVDISGIALLDSNDMGEAVEMTGARILLNPRQI